jgi:leucyl/phenylalanyl-tRNA--protein transferase
MARRDNILIGLTPEVLLKAYACGIFPMAEDADDPALFWIDPPERGIIPLDAFHVPSRLARTVRSTELTVTCDRDFSAVIDGCAEPGPKRARTWINAPIRHLYRGLFELGHCHTVEVYDARRWLAGCMASASGARSSARACSTACAMPPRSRWCIWSRD